MNGGLLFQGEAGTWLGAALSLLFFFSFPLIANDQFGRTGVRIGCMGILLAVLCLFGWYRAWQENIKKQNEWMAYRDRNCRLVEKTESNVKWNIYLCAGGVKVIKNAENDPE